MSRSLAITLTGLVLLSACASHDGTYSPACLAFAGDTVELRDGRFAWDRFTDEVHVGDDGQVVDPFPGFPVHGDYELDGDRLVLKPDSGATLDEHFLLRSGGDFYILTAPQYAEWRSSGDPGKCALVRGGRRDD